MTLPTSEITFVLDLFNEGMGHEKE
jgi:hypothetical protein